MSPELRAALEKLLNAKTFGVFCAPDEREESLLASSALVLGLTRAGCAVACDPLPENFRKKWLALLPQENFTAPSRPLTVALPRKDGLEIAYEETAGELILKITSASPIMPLEIKISESLTPLETVFCFAENENLLAPLAARFALPPKNRIILIAPGKERLASKKVSDLLCLLRGAVWNDSGVATLLFAALVTETDNFQKNLSPSILTLAATLLESGADKEKIREARRPVSIAAANTTESKILGRALARTYRDEAVRAAWTFLLPHDLEKTEAIPAPALFAELYGTMRQILPTSDLHLFLWKETGGFVHSLAFADDTEILKILAAKFDATSEINKEFVKLPSFPNFSAAEKQLRELLRGFR